MRKMRGRAVVLVKGALRGNRPNPVPPEKPPKPKPSKSI